MLRSENRILTTHAGSLPRREGLTAMLVKSSRGEAVDRAELLREIEVSTRYVVHKQLEAGIDVGNNGEQSRESFFTYVQHRMTGFGGRSERPIMRDLVRYPSFLKMMAPLFQRSMVDLLHAPKAIGEVHYRDLGGVDLECADTLGILDDQPTKFAEPFMTAPSPGIIASAMLNEYYENYEKYVIAIAKALHTEYEYIVSKGFVLQVDCPDLAMERHTSYADRPLTEFLDYVTIEYRSDEPRAARNCAAIGSACTCAGATTKRRTISTCRWRRYCRCYTTRTSARWCWRRPTRGISTNTDASRSSRCRST